jgi:hypothetical protein
LDGFPYIEHVENITESEYHSPPPPLLWTEIYPSTGATLVDYIVELWECDAQDYLETNLQNISYNAFAMCEGYKYTQRGIQRKGMNTYYDNMPKEDNTTVRFPFFTQGDGIQKLVTNMPDGQDIGEWELHTPEDMRWNENYQHSIKYCIQDIMKSIRCLMWQPAYTNHLNCAPQRCFNSDTPPKLLNIKMYTANWWWKTQVRRDTPG